MAASLNKVLLMGNLTRDIELRHTQGGTAVTDLGMAINDRRKNQAGEFVEDTVFVDVTLWGRTAEVAAEYLSKGSSVLIEGRLKLDQWESEGGEKRQKLKVVGEKMQMLGKRNDSEDGGNARPQSQSQPQNQNESGSSPPDSEIPF